MDSPARLPSANAILRLQDLEIDVGRQRVTRHGHEIPLPKLSFDLLLALVRAAPQVLSNQELMTRVWPGLVVSPETVNQRVKLLRDALGDDARAPRYIVGLRGRGYRIDSPVTEAHADASVAPTGAVAPAPAVMAVAAARVARRPTSSWIAIAAVSLGVIGGAVVLPALLRSPDAGRGAIESEAVARNASAAAAQTVAVLPFENLSGTAADDYLALGIPEIVLDRLSGVSGLTVIARSSSFRAAAQATDPSDIGRRLNAGYLVDGSVQRSGDVLRVTAQLIDARAGTQLWSQHFERPLAELFTIQDEIAAHLTGVLAARVPLASPNAASAREPRSLNVQAQLAYLRGRALLARYTAGDAAAAATQFEAAIALDPTFAAAYASLYDANLLATERRHGDLAAERERQRETIERALALDPNAGSAFFARAIWGSGSPSEREADFRRGVALDPSNGRGLTAYEEFLDKQGRPQEGLEMLRRALLVDPLSPRAHFRLVQRTFDESGKAQLEQGMLEVLRLDPEFHPALQRYAKYRWMLHGEVAEAIQVIEKAVAVDPLNPWSRHTAAAMYLDIGDVAAARDVAAGTASSARTAQILLALQAGDWRRAGEYALSDAGQRYNQYESWGVSEAVRDYGLRSGELRRAIAYLEKRYALDDAPATDVGGFRPAVYRAQLLIASGEVDRGRRLLAAQRPLIDRSLPKFGSVYALRTRASLRLLDGDRAGALADLEASFADGDYTQWWYTLERDPLWLPLHGDPRFQALVDLVHEHVAQQRALQEQYLRQGLVPKRPGAAAAAVPAA